MANILTSLLYWKRPEEEQFWKDITDFSINSFKGRLQGDWEYRQIYQDGSQEQDHLFFNCFDQLHKWWEEGHNVLYVNVDMICVRPVDFFGKYDFLFLPWQTDPPTTERFPVNFNCAVMYLPKEIKKKIWDYGYKEYDKYFKSGNPVPWAADQDIYNLMFYKQGIDPHKVMDNNLHFLDKTPHLNVVKKEDARILHYLTTRGTNDAFAKMKEDLPIYGRYD